MADWIYVDNSNVFIEGQRVSALAKGMALNIYDAFDGDVPPRVEFGWAVRPG